MYGLGIGEENKGAVQRFHEKVNKGSSKMGKDIGGGGMWRWGKKGETKGKEKRKEGERREK